MNRHRLIALATATGLAVLTLAGCGEDRGGTAGAPVEASPAATSTPPPSQPVSEPVSEQPTSPWPAASQVPDDFPLAAGLPERNGDDGTPVEMVERTSLGDLVLCGEAPWSAEGAVDVAGAVFTGEAEDVRSRTLALYPDSATAAAALQDFRDVVAACPEESADGTTQVYEEVEGGSDSVVLAHRYRIDGTGFDTGLETLALHRVGNALLVATYYGEANGSAESVAGFLRFGERSTAPVLRAMRVFADEPAGDVGGAEASGLPADFALADGWPTDHEPGAEHGVTGPASDLEALVFDRTACDTPAPEAPDGADRLRATWENPEDHRARELLAFPDGAAAGAYLDAMREHVEACPTEEIGPDFVSMREVLTSDVGEESFAVAQRAEDGGAPAIGLEVMQVVRVDRTVLVETAGSEGGLQPTRDVRTALARLDDGAVPVVAAMADLP